MEEQSKDAYASIDAAAEEGEGEEAAEKKKKKASTKKKEKKKVEGLVEYHKDFDLL